MAKERSKDNMSVFSDVITSLAADAASEIEGVELLRSKGKRLSGQSGVFVYFLPNDKVTIDLFVNVCFGSVIPSTVAHVQEKVKSEVEGATKYRVLSVNVQVVDVIFPS